MLYASWNAVAHLKANHVRAEVYISEEPLPFFCCELGTCSNACQHLRIGQSAQSPTYGKHQLF